MSGRGYGPGDEIVDRGFSMGRVVSMTLGVLGRNLGAIVLVAFVVSLVMVALAYGAAYAIERLNGPGMGTYVVTTALGIIIGVVFRSAGTGGVMHIAMSDLNEQRASAGAAFATGLRLALPLTGLGLVIGLGIGFACLLLVVPGLMLAMAWFVATPARVVEGPGVRAAVRRSEELTSGHRWKLFGLAVAGGLLIFGLGWLTGFVGSRFSLGADFTTRLTVNGVVQVIASTIGISLSAAGYAVCYAELRRLKEGATPSQLAAVFA